MPRFKKLYDKFKPLGVEFIGVIIDQEEKRDAIRQIMAKNGVDWPQIFTGKDADAFCQKYAVQGLPKYFVVDQRGRFVTSGQMSKVELDELFTELLSKNRVTTTR